MIMEDDADDRSYLPTEEEIEEAVVLLRKKKVQSVKESNGQLREPKSHGRVMQVHHCWNGEAVFKEQ